LNYLIDTNVLSAARAAARLPKAAIEWLDAANPDETFVSAVTIFELEIGTRRMERRDKAQGAVLRRWKNERVLKGFAGRVIPIDSEIAECGAGLQVPNPRPVIDSLLAATAIVRNMILVTRNERDFEGLPVKTLNPWTANL